MSGGGLPPLDPYIVARNFYLNSIRWTHAFKRVHGITRPTQERRAWQKELCKLRKEKYK